jgi:hypothetical protein
MFRWVRLLLGLGAFLLLFPGQAGGAWLETRVKAHKATLTVERDGRALVDHELTLGVRGGPLKSFELSGVDSDAATESDATVVPVVRLGEPKPIPLTLLRGDDGTLRLDIDHPKGLRTGTYVFRFRYTTNLRARDKIRRRGTAAEVEWVGPRFADGIDVAKVVFRLPSGPIPPSLPTPEDSDESQLLGSAFLSQLRPDGANVEVELIRPHVARGEPAVWRVLTSPKVFAGLDEPDRTAPAPGAAPPVVEPPPGERLVTLFGALGLAVAFALLVALKWRLFGKDCRAVKALPRALVPLPIAARAAVSGALLSGAAVLAGLADHPTTGAFLLLGCVCVAMVGAPRLLLAPRGAGHWLPLKDADAFTRAKARRAGRFLDCGTLPGAALFLLGLSVIGVVVALLLPRSPYLALCLALGSTCLLPIFASGRGAQLPGAERERASRVLPALARSLRRRGYRTCAWARVANGENEQDELRLLVRPTAPREGLLGVEIGMQEQATIGGYLLMPFVLVRAREGSLAQQSLRQDVVWQRGRGPEERVAIVRPGVPARGLLIELVGELVRQLSDESRRAPSRARNSRGASSLTSKLGAASPAHAT